jgi:hypothetical protein
LPSPSTQQHLRLESERRLALTVTLVLVLPGILWALVDLDQVSGTRLVVSNVVRFSQVLLWLGAIALIRRAPTRERLRNICFWLAMSVSLFALGVCWIRPGDNPMPLRTIVLISIATFVVYPYEFRRQLINWGVLLVGAASLLLVHYASVPAIDRIAGLTNIILAGALGIVVSRNRRALDDALDAAMAAERDAIEERERAAAALRGLQGIIRICAHCHQVRTDAGAWEKLEQYVREHTDAEFSHGLCPDCLETYYPADPVG